MKIPETPPVIVKKITLVGNGYQLEYIDDYTELVYEWITNGVNGTPQEILEYMRDGEFSPNDCKDSFVYGFLEALAQSDEPEVALLYEKPPQKVIVKTVTDEWAALMA